MKYLVCLVLCWSLMARAEEITIATGEWPPYSGADLPRQGTIMALLSDTFAEAGITVRYAFMPWNRALELTRAGKYAVTPMWLKTPDRERDFILLGPIATSTVVLFHRKDRPLEWQTIDDLKSLRLGITHGYSYGPEMDKALAEGSLQAEVGPTDEINLRKLAGGRIDAFPLDREVGRFLIGQSTLPAVRTDLTFHARPVHNEPLYLMVSRKSPNALEISRRFSAIWPKFRPAGLPTQ